MATWKKKFTRFYLPLIAGCGFMCGALYGQWAYQKSKIETYLKVNIEGIISEQERNLNVSFQGRPSFIVTRSINPFNFMFYNAGQDTIEVDMRGFNLFTLPNDDPRMAQLLKSGLSHELGHFYIDKLHEQDYGRDYSPDSVKRKFLGEGMAEHFHVDGKPDHFYDSLHDMVKPFLETNGVSEGIRYVFEHENEISLPENLEKMAQQAQATFK